MYSTKPVQSFPRWQFALNFANLKKKLLSLICAKSSDTLFRKDLIVTKSRTLQRPNAFLSRSEMIHFFASQFKLWWTCHLRAIFDYQSAAFGLFCVQITFLMQYHPSESVHTKCNQNKNKKMQKFVEMSLISWCTGE